MDKELGFINVIVREDFQIKVDSNLQVPDIIGLFRSMADEFEQGLEQEEVQQEEE